MFELTNEQRKCFALSPVLDAWERVEVKPSPYDKHKTYAYLDGHRVVKVIEICEDPMWELYSEYSVNEILSEDKTKILPKTTKGKPQNFTSSNLQKKTRIGMTISYYTDYVYIYNATTQQDFYRSMYDGVKFENFADFQKWVDSWCSDTGEKELEEINTFAQRSKVHQKFKEGDFFRYRINRFLYGYGRIILDYDKMRKEGTKFWDVFMGKPVCVSVYHIATEDATLTPEQLLSKKTLPSQVIMDNIFYYGECEVIGNIPLKEEEKDYPIHYGRSISAKERNRTNYQHGKTFISVKDANAPHPNYIFNGVGFSLHVILPILFECIETDSNKPYWEMAPIGWVSGDLRNPKLKDTLVEIEKYLGISH